jgi:hypothetical protein
MESFEVAEQIQLCQRKLLEALGELDKEVKSKRHSTAIAILDRLRGEMTDAMYEKKIAVGVIKDIIKKSTHEELKAVVQVEDDLTLIDTCRICRRTNNADCPRNKFREISPKLPRQGT